MTHSAPLPRPVIPAKAGISQLHYRFPACAGMTATTGEHP
jgi:hypothetical protein